VKHVRMYVGFCTIDPTQFRYAVSNERNKLPRSHENGPLYVFRNRPMPSRNALLYTCIYIDSVVFTYFNPPSTITLTRDNLHVDCSILHHSFGPLSVFDKRNSREIRFSCNSLI